MSINVLAFTNAIRALRESKEPLLFMMGCYARSCGTPACVLGHYAAREDLQDTFVLKGRYVYLKEAFGSMVNYTSEEVQHHFGITVDQCEELFGPHGCCYASSVDGAIKYLEDFVTRAQPC